MAVVVVKETAAVVFRAPAYSIVSADRHSGTGYKDVGGYHAISGTATNWIHTVALSGIIGRENCSVKYRYAQALISQEFYLYLL